MEIAEFRAQAQRMCDAGGCKSCQFAFSLECKMIRQICQDGFLAIVAGVDDWVAENPGVAGDAQDKPGERYPSWTEGWERKFPESRDIPCPATTFGHDYVDAECVKRPDSGGAYCELCKSRPMHPAVAEKLGVKPIGWEDAS